MNIIKMRDREIYKNFIFKYYIKEAPNFTEKFWYLVKDSLPESHKHIAVLAFHFYVIHEKFGFASATKTFP